VTTLEQLEATRPRWHWRNALAKPHTILVEPAFKPELGDVFLAVGERAAPGRCGPHHGIWLDERRAEELIAAIRGALAWARDWERAWAEAEAS
jgi:hypothetical protein